MGILRVWCKSFVEKGVLYMGNSLVGTIRLSSEESINFVNALFRPSQEMIEIRNRILDDVESTVVIRRTKEGFEADIDDLDLSFLDDNESKKISMVTTVKLNISKNYSSQDGIIDRTIVVAKDKGMYVKVSNCSYMNGAA